MSGMWSFGPFGPFLNPLNQSKFDMAASTPDVNVNFDICTPAFATNFIMGTSVVCFIVKNGC